MRRGYHHGNLREALIEAALTLIAEKGPSGFTLSEAAREAGDRARRAAFARLSRLYRRGIAAHPGQTPLFALGQPSSAQLQALVPEFSPARH